MSFFDAFIGGAAEQGAAYASDSIKNDELLERQKQLAQFNADMDEKKQQTKLKLAAEMGQKISDGADQMNFGRIADSINQKNGSSMTADDAKDIAKNPEALKAYGIIDRSRAQTLDDKASVAEKFGALDQAKDIRGQQQIEISRERDDKRDDHTIKQDALAEKRWQTQDEWQKSRAVIADRLAAVQESRLGRMEKSSYSQMERAELNSTRQSLQSILKDYALQDEKVLGQMATVHSKMNDPNITPEQRKPYQDQLDELERRHKSIEPDRNHVVKELYKLAGVEAPKADPRIEQQAQSDASSAVQSGRISAQDANKRLASAGYAPISLVQQKAVSGGEFEKTTNAELKRIAQKPRGVSSQEANAAQAELDTRSSDQRMKAF